jgi:hypothetical protein
MPTSKADIYNRTLANLGQLSGQEIADPDEESVNANALNRFYPESLDSFLEECWWGFARKYQFISLDGSTPPEHWTYAYTYPSDSVSPRFIVGDAPEDRIEFEEGQSAGGLAVIWTDRKNAELCYTARVENYNAWGGAAITAFSFKLAADSAALFSGGAKNAELLQGKYEFALDKAMDVTHARGEPRREDNKELIDFRHGEDPSERFSSRFDNKL